MENLEVLEPASEVVQFDRDKFTKDLIRKIQAKESKLSYTSISQFKKSPKSFIDYKCQPKKETDAMDLGKLVHCLVLTPKLFERDYFVFDDSEKVKEIGGGNPRATNVYKAWKAERMAEAGCKKCLSDVDYQAAQMMSDAILNNSASKPLLDRCPQRETKVDFEFNGLPFVSFIDGMGPDHLIDIKVCVDADPKKFQRTIIYDGYYLQGAVYLTAIEEMKPYYLIAVGRTGAVSVHLLMDAFLEFGMNEFHKLTNEFKACMKANDFHCSYEYRAHDGIYRMDKPAYIN